MPRTDCCETNDDGIPKCDGTCVGRHACPDWDYMVITDSDPEWECCSCGRYGGRDRDTMTEHFCVNAKTNPGMGD